MEQISREQFENEAPLNGVFVFSMHEECPLCEEYLKILEHYDTSGWKEVVLKPEDKEWVVKELVIHGFPATRFYVDGLCTFDRGGILYSTQLKKLRKQQRDFKGYYDA